MVARRALASAFAILLTVAAATPAVADEPFRLRQLHVIVAPDRESASLRVLEIAILQNEGAAPVDATVRFPLPADAYDLELGAGYLGRSSAVPGGIEWAGALAPGPTELVLGYRIAYGGAYVLRRLLPLRAGAVDVMVEDAGLTVGSRELSGPVAVTAGDTRFLRLTGKDVPAGTIVSVEIRGGIGGASRGLTPGDVLAPIGLVLLGALTAVVLVRPRLRSRQASGAPRAPVRAKRKRADAEDDELTEEQLEEGALT